MKKIAKILVVAAAMVAFGTGAYAQSNANADLSASATVLTALTITKNTDVLFGNVGSTTAGVVYLDPKGTANNFVGTTAHIGTLTIAGSNSSSVRLTWPANVSLSDGTHNLNYVLKVNGSSTDQASSSTLALTSGYTDVTTSASGAYLIFVGGSLGRSNTTPAALSSQAAGTYTGTANFTVVYN